tara:strand:- start:138709 stop:139248 length:540 start_codon:yes stop_codon:yes gene_type:complete
MRALALLPSLLVASACGGGQGARGQVPHVDPAKAAAVTAAAAALVTLADPDHAKRIQERKGDDGKPGRTKENHEQVPEEVLTRSEDYAKAKEYMDAKRAADAAKRPCKNISEDEPAEKGGDKQRLKLIPDMAPTNVPHKVESSNDESSEASDSDSERDSEDTPKPCKPEDDTGDTATSD